MCVCLSSSWHPLSGQRVTGCVVVIGVRSRVRVRLSCGLCRSHKSAALCKAWAAVCAGYALCLHRRAAITCGGSVSSSWAGLTPCRSVSVVWLSCRVCALSQCRALCAGVAALCEGYRCLSMRCVLVTPRRCVNSGPLSAPAPALEMDMLCVSRAAALVSMALISCLNLPSKTALSRWPPFCLPHMALCAALRSVSLASAACTSARCVVPGIAHVCCIGSVSSGPLCALAASHVCYARSVQGAALSIALAALTHPCFSRVGRPARVRAMALIHRCALSWP